MRVRIQATWVGAVVVSFLSLSSVQAQVANPRGCITGMNTAGAKLGVVAQEEASYCAKLVKRGDLPAGVTAQECLGADLRGRVSTKSARVSTIDAARCTPAPAFGYSGAATVSAAGKTLGLDLVADLFGADFGAAIFTIPCQTRLLRDVTRLTDAQLGEFRACKKTGLGDGTIDDTASLAACLNAIDTDQHGKVGDALGRLAADDAQYCGLFNRAQLFPGYCAFGNDFLACVDVRARCRVCEALNQMDALAMDCEQFDDGLANGSCGPCAPDPDGLCCNASQRDVCGYCGGTGFRCGWAEISVAPTHACGRKLDGSLACWGHNYAGELAAPGGAFTQVVSGGSSSEVTNRGHSCALRPDQTAECWGRNDFGQASPPPDTFVQLAAGSHHTCGLHPDGTITCWGLNDFGPAPSGTFTRISALRRANCALRTDGEVECWGDNYYGSLTPPPGPFIDVEAGPVESYAILPDQTLVHWGEPGAQFIPPAGAFVEVDGCTVNGCARRPDGSIACWPDPPPVMAVTLPPSTGAFTQMDAGERIYCAIRSDTMLVCWGDLYTQSGPPPK